MEREISQQLVAWKSRKDRKPLILYGVRQVGKTYILKEFAKAHFPVTHYLNFEEDDRLETIFADDLKPNRIIAALNFYLDISIDINHDLVIFDEIQACPRALTSLKYFQEKMPELALCSAGSLLGVHLAPVSFPVGKVDMLNMYPMSFEEFLRATGKQQSIEFLESVRLDTQIPDIVHEQLWQQLKVYLIVGGLPEVVHTFKEQMENLYEATQAVRIKQEELITAYHANIAKHSGKVNAMYIDRAWHSVPQQLASSIDGSASRFKFKGILSTNSRYSQLAGPIDWLKAANLVIKTPIVNRGEQPLSAFSKESFFKLYMFDIGILGAMGYLQPKTIIDYDFGTYKGYMAENFVAQEFLKATNRPSFTWQEGRSELEFVREVEGEILPVEIKSGWVTKSKSLNKFSEKYKVPYRTIMSANNLHIDKKNKLHRYPLYLASRFPLEE